MENENTCNGKMENIFYAALALHVAGKPITKENIRIVLRSAGTQVDEPALDIIAAFMESLKASHYEKEGLNDPRVIRLLTSALSHQEVPTQQLEALIRELAASEPAKLNIREVKREENPEPAIEGILKLPEDSRKVDPLEVINRIIQVAELKVPAQELITGAQSKGRYIYGITGGGKEVKLGPIGIDGSEVYTVCYQDLGAIVHDCVTEPYQSLDDEKVKEWVKTHQSVLDIAKEQFQIIIPLGFDTILKANDSISPDQVIKDWLKGEYSRFQAVISQIQGKDEYAVQVSYSPLAIDKYMSEPSEEVKTIREQLSKKSPGIAYIYQQKLEKAIKTDIARLADSWFEDFFSRIIKHAADVTVEKTRKLDSDKVMLLNLSCLVAKDKVAGLGEELEKINNMEGFSVHFSGPWPPYSFVARPIVAGEKEGSDESH